MTECSEYILVLFRTIVDMRFDQKVLGLLLCYYGAVAMIMEPKYAEWSHSAQIDFELCHIYALSYKFSLTSVVYSSMWKVSV